MQGAAWEECQGSRLNQAGGEPRENEDLWTSACIGGQSEAHKQKV